MIVRIGLALFVGIGLTLGGYQGARALEASVEGQVQQLQAAQVHERAAFRVGDLEQAVREGAAYLTDREVNLMKFKPRLRMTYDHHQVFRAVAWLPVVQQADTDGFLAQVRRAMPDFTFRELDVATGEVRPAGKALAYVPFLMVEPEHGNEAIVGLDLGNQSNLADAMQLSYKIKDVGAASASVLPPDDGASLLMLHYVHDPEGFVAGLVRVDDLLAHVMDGAPAGLVGRLVDHTAGSETLATQEGFVDGASVMSGSFALGGRRMVLELTATDAYEPLGLQLAEAAGFGGAGVTLVLLAMALLAAPSSRDE